MKTSRLEGVLSMMTKKPYKVGIGGQQEDRNEIILYDVDSKCEGAAADMEQLVMAAVSSIEGKATSSKTQMKKEEAKAQAFYDNDSPSEAEVEEQAAQLLLVFKMNRNVKLSEVIDIFTHFINAGRVRYAPGDGTNILAPIWETIDRRDKERIIFHYIAFFDNPLELLSSMAQ